MQADKTPPLPENTIEIVAALTFAAILASAVALIAGGLVRRLLASVEGRHHHLAAPLGKAPVRLVRLVAFVVSTIAFAFPALAFVGIDLPVELQGGRVGRWAARLLASSGAAAPS